MKTHYLPSSWAVPLDEITILSPKDICVKMRKRGQFLLKAIKTHFNATFPHPSTAFKDVSSSSVLSDLSKQKIVFRDFRLFSGIEHSVKRLLLEICRFLQPSTTTTEPITLPLAHARGVITYRICITSFGSP